MAQVPWNAFAEHLWGLHPTMPPPSSDSEGLDIMAVHGFQPGSGADAHLRAFTDSEGFNWLRDGLHQALAPPNEQPLANLNSYTLRLSLDVLDSLSVLNIYDVATLLKVLLPDTGGFQGLGANNRKVVLVAHSLGGLVIKAWLLRLAECSAGLSDNHYDRFLRSVAGIVFFAVPIGDSRIASVTKSALPLHSAVFNRLLSSKPRLRDLEQRFESEVMAKYRIPSCGVYETKKTKVWGSGMLGLGLMMVPRPSALIQSEESVPATEDHCQAAQLSPSQLEYLSVINFIRKCERQRGNQILVPNSGQALQPPSSMHLHAASASKPDHVILPLTQAMSAAGISGQAVASTGQTSAVSITVFLESPDAVSDMTFHSMCTAFHAASGSCGPFNLTTGSRALHVDFESSLPGSPARCSEKVAPRISQACLLGYNPIEGTGEAREPTYLVMLTGSNLDAATLHAHAAAEHIQLGRPAESKIGWAPEVLSFVCPVELLSEEHIVLEACRDGAWSNPLVLPLLAAEPPDNLDSYLAASPAEERQELEYRLAGVLGGFSEDESDFDWEDEIPDPWQKPGGWDLPQERSPDIM